MVAATEAEGGDAAEEHLYPARNRHDFTDHAVACDDMPTYTRVYALCQVKFEVYTQHDLEKEHQHEGRGEGGVYVGCELTAAMSMAQEITDESSHGAEHLDRDMPSRSDNLDDSVSTERRDLDIVLCGATYPKDHPSRKDQAKGDDLKYDMYP